MANRQLNGNVHGVVVKMNTARRRLDGKRRRRDEKREVEWRVTILYTYIYIFFMQPSRRGRRRKEQPVAASDI